MGGSGYMSLLVLSLIPKQCDPTPHHHDRITLPEQGNAIPILNGPLPPAGCSGRVDSTCAGSLPIESRHPTSATYVACREHDGLPCWLSRGQQVPHQR